MLTHPLALLGLAAAVPALLALYLLRNRVKRQKVSSLMLWVERSRMTQGGKRLQRNHLPLLFFLELLILLLLIWAAAGPKMLSRRSTRPLTVILDNSASMSAIGPDGKSTVQRALKRLPEIIREERFAPVRMILAGQEARWLNVESVKQLLQGIPIAPWHAQAAGFKVEKALRLARTGNHPESRLLIISDTPPEQSPADQTLRWLALGTPIPNAGFVNAVRSGKRCMLEIQGEGTVQMTLSLGEENRTVPVELEPGVPRRMVFRVDEPTAHFKASLPDDALMIDNQILLLPAPERQVRIKQEIQHPQLQKLVNDAIESTDRQETSPGPTELLITDSEIPITESETWTLQIVSPTNAQPFIGPFVVDHSSPLMEGISFEGTAWAASKTQPLPGTPIVMAGQTPLLTRMDDWMGRARFAMQINPQRSTLPHSPSWPTLFWNLVQARSECKPGFREVNLRIGMPPAFTGSAPLPALTTPGPIEVESNGQVFRAALNFLDPAESDLSDCGTAFDGDWMESTALNRHHADLSPLAIWLAFALLGLHQFLLRKENHA